MKMIRLLFIICLCTFQATVKAQTLHLVMFCDTNDRSIGENKEAERKIISNEMQTIGNILEEYGYQVMPIESVGEYCNKNNLMQTIKGLDVGPEDVVLFWYGGHGSRAFKNEEDPFPQMVLGEDYQENWVPATLIKNMIMKKNPRLAIILTACCNKEQGSVSIKSVIAESPYTKESSINKEAYKKLFLDAKGLVMMTSSKAGQYSFSGREGGIFCLYFWRALEMVGEGSLKPDWNIICSSVKQAVSQKPIEFEGEMIYQEPYYQVTTNSSPTNTTNVNRNTTHTVTVNNQTSTLAYDINKLLDQTLSKEQRLRMVDEVLAKHFYPGAKVITKARNMTTNVDYEDAVVFLRRIALSPFIKHINVISEDGTGKQSQIIVHEVRTN